MKEGVSAARFGELAIFQMITATIRSKTCGRSTSVCPRRAAPVASITATELILSRDISYV